MPSPYRVDNRIAYQIFPDRFSNLGQARDLPWRQTPDVHGHQGGTLEGITRNLSYIKSLGANLAYLTPIFDSPSNHRYDARDFFTVDPVLGTAEDFTALARKAHQLDVKVMLDLAFNHTSEDHQTFRRALEGDQAARTWYNIVDGQVNAPGWVRHNGVSYQTWSGYAHMPKLNISHVPVRLHHIDVIKHWSQLGADAFRFDVPSDIDDSYFWNDVDLASDGKFLIAELWWEQRDWVKKNGMDGQMNYPLLYYMLHYFAGDSVRHWELDGCGLGEGYNKGFSRQNREYQTFCDSLERLFAVGSPADSVDRRTAYSNMNLLGSHDTPRIATYIPERSIREQMLAFMMLVPGVPMIYYGDEVGMLGRRDPDNRWAFDWDRDSWDKGYLNLVKRLAAFRRSDPALGQGEFNIEYADSEMLAFRRQSGEHQVIAIFNRNYGPREFTFFRETPMSERISGDSKVSKGDQVLVPAKGFRIFSN
jgi:cyclomaltodextrinase / maltogenic alpha-amylase / neopullulanase